MSTPSALREAAIADRDVSPRPVRVVVLVDIDGVLALWDEDEPDLCAWPAESWVRTDLTQLRPRLRGDITWSTAAIDQLRAVAQMPGVEMRWCTAWQRLAPDVFGVLVDLGSEWPWMRQPATGGLDLLWWWKADHARKAIEDGYRVAWIDDEVGHWVLNARLHTSLNDNRWAETEELLCLATETRKGLTPEHLSQLARFVAGSTSNPG